MSKPRRAILVAGTAAFSVVATAGVALASATSKRPSYDWHAEAASGLEIEPFTELAPEELAALRDMSLTIGHTSSESDTSDTEARSTGSADALSINGQSVGGNVDCGSTGGTGGTNVDSDDAGVGQEVAGVGVWILSATCKSRATQTNEASSSASTSLVTITGADHRIVVLGSESSSRTTSGQSGSGKTESEFAVAKIDGTTVLGCESSAHKTKGNEKTSSAVIVAGVEYPHECPVASASTEPADDAD
jgi:hypothetical protein